MQVTKLGKKEKETNLKSVDVKVLEGLGLYDPRNKTKLAAQLNMSRETLSYRIKCLRSHFSLYLQANLYHTNIGLRKAMAFAESKPGYEELLVQCLKSNDYWLYVSQCIGASKCLATYGIPAGKEPEFEGFLAKLGESEQVSDVSFFWSTCIHNVNATTTWFDKTSEKWMFPWDSWLKEISTSNRELPYTLKEPEGYFQKADWVDIMILKELEKNYAITFEAIAKQLNTSKQRIKYHFKNHIVKKRMLEGPQILAAHYSGLSPETCFFIFTFKSFKDFSRFATSLLNKPFVRAMGKVYHKDQLFARLYLPRQELRNFIEALSKLVRTRFIETYQYVIEDPAKVERQTISYEFFKDGNWRYDHQKHLEKLQSAIEESVILS
jgi:DNA-binding Lrp family transcriptional regulator